jgi:toxin HigB-1
LWERSPKDKEITQRMMMSSRRAGRLSSKRWMLRPRHKSFCRRSLLVVADVAWLQNRSGFAMGSIVGISRPSPASYAAGHRAKHTTFASPSRVRLAARSATTTRKAQQIGRSFRQIAAVLNVRGIAVAREESGQPGSCDGDEHHAPSQNSGRSILGKPTTELRNLLWRNYCKPSADGLHSNMIKRFRHKGLESLFLTGSTKGKDAQLAAKLRRMLLRLNDGPLPEAMSLPGYWLHQLKGDRKGSWSVWVSGHFRLIFEIEGEDATNVDFEDYR